MPKFWVGFVIIALHADNRVLLPVLSCNYFSRFIPAPRRGLLERALRRRFGNGSRRSVCLHEGSKGRRPNGFLGLSLNDRTNLFLVILLDKTVSVG